jgi:tetraacyldisaccharide 4'-kinase
MNGREAVESIWAGRGPLPAVLRAALVPASLLFRATIAFRNARFDRGQGVSPTALPALSVGNLSVGGTGKTPIAAWCCRELQRLGAHPAVVLRGYGDDEPLVHGLLSPGVPVIASPDRVAGIARAAAAGADVVVLDDAFQHRRATRVADLVLISADDFSSPQHLLPAGPWREPLTALRRATCVVVTVKAASTAQVERVLAAVRGAAPKVPVAVVGIVPDALHRVPGEAEVAAPDGSGLPLEDLAGRRVLAISAIGNPSAFAAQLQGAGAHVTSRVFPDHHAFTAGDVSALSATASAVDLAVCTLKDAVKLAPLWPRAAPALWYVSQTIEVRLGLDALQSAFGRVLAARPLPHAASLPTAG